MAGKSARHTTALRVAAAVAALVAVQAAAWIYFRARQPRIDGETRARLRPRARA